MEPFFPKQQCGFGKGYSTQNCLLSLPEKRESVVDKGKYFGALLKTYQKPSIVFLTNLHLQNYMGMVLAWDWYIVTSQKAKDKSKWQL